MKVEVDSHEFQTALDAFKRLGWRVESIDVEGVSGYVLTVSIPRPDPEPMLDFQ